MSGPPAFGSNAPGLRDGWDQRARNKAKRPAFGKSHQIEASLVAQAGLATQSPTRGSV